MVRVKIWASLKVIVRAKDTSSGVVMVRGRAKRRTRTRTTITLKIGLGIWLQLGLEKSCFQ